MLYVTPAMRAKMFKSYIASLL